MATVVAPLTEQHHVCCLLGHKYTSWRRRRRKLYQSSWYCSNRIKVKSQDRFCICEYSQIKVTMIFDCTLRVQSSSLQRCSTFRPRCSVYFHSPDLSLPPTSIPPPHVDYLWFPLRSVRTPPAVNQQWKPVNKLWPSCCSDVWLLLTVEPNSDSALQSTTTLFTHLGSLCAYSLIPECVHACVCVKQSAADPDIRITENERAMKHEVWKAGDIIQAENEQNQILTSVTIFRISVSVCVWVVVRVCVGWYYKSCLSWWVLCNKQLLQVGSRNFDLLTS